MTNSLTKTCILLLAALQFLLAVQGFTPSASVATATTTTTQLSMAVALPSPKSLLGRQRRRRSSSSIRGKRWYDEIQPMGSRRTIYNDDIFDYMDDDDDDDARPFAGVISAPFVLTSPSTATSPTSSRGTRKRDKVRTVASWAVQSLLRRKRNAAD